MSTKKIKKNIYAKKACPERSRRVFVGMSGGVDSSVAALLLQKQGYEIVGCFIKGWYPSGFYCSWREDRRDAMRVCAKLGIPFITIDAEKEYKKEVVDYMIKEFRAGRTPNPDVMCNKHIKFGVFLNKAIKMGADYIATGHYVKLEKSEIRNPKSETIVKYKKIKKVLDFKHSDLEFVSNFDIRASNLKLKIAADTNKDQSYFLWALTQKQLQYCLFPLGGMLKPEVKNIARKNGLITADKKESMGVCFIGEFDINEFLKKYIKTKKGKIVTTDGKAVGEHEGVMFYTIGQRHGFSGGGGIPFYIVDKDIKKNLLIVADKARQENFYKKEVELRNTNWISGEALKQNKTYQARIRYRQPLQNCKIKIQNKKIKVVFSKPQRAVTSGQSLVIYDKQKMLGGGIII